MAIAERSARTTWRGSLPKGEGTIEPHSEAFSPLPVTWASRTERPDGKTSPEELAAAAHSSCFAMAFSLCLGEAGQDPDELDVTSKVTLDEVDGKPTIVSSALTVRATMPGMSQDDFDGALDKAKALCPVSRLFAGAEITVDASLA